MSNYYNILTDAQMYAILEQYKNVTLKKKSI